MQNLMYTWTSLDRRKQILAVLSALVVFAGVLGLSRMAAQPSWRLLYSGLESGTAGEVVRSLEQRGARYEVRGNSIYVEAASRDELRMTLAAEGLPANGGRGYELLDNLSGFGTTSQMFDAAYWRAKEGELARTIVSAPYVSLARVHIANTSGNAFQRTAEPSASVSLTPSGAPISVVQADALRHLVASAVAGLSPDNVTVIDTTGQLIGAEEKGGGASTAQSRGDLMRERVLRIVEARVGQGNAFVEVSVDTVTESETIRERRLDPGSRVAVSTDTEETANSSTSTAGQVSANSNLPDGDAAKGDDSRAQKSQTRERVNYEVSETEREVQRGPGEIRRLTVAVLVNGIREGNDSSTFQPRSEEELVALRELVESAVGFNAERGDVITIKSMDLPQVSPAGTEVSQPFLDASGLDVMSLAQMALLAAVVLFLGLFVLRPVLLRPTPAASSAALSSGRIGSNPESEPASTVPAADARLTQAEADVAALPTPSSGQAAVERLRAMIGDRQDETVEILKNWLEERREKV